MKINTPVTQRENDYPDSFTLVSTTDTKGIITYCNQAFVTVCGFSEQELLGANHNIVRHPDMPPAAFKDLWDTVKTGRSWRGIVKNRCKNGDHYWVDAYVTPVYQGEQLVGYQSVRVKPDREHVNRAAQLYAELQAKKLDTLPRQWSLQFGYRHQIFLSFLVVGIGALAAGWLQQLWLGLATLIVALGLAQWLSWRLFAPVKQIVLVAKNIAGGDLSTPIRVERCDEITDILQAIKMVQARLATVMGHLQESASSLAQASGEVATASHEAHQLMERQHQETDMVATAMNEMSATVSEVARNTAAASESATSAAAKAQDGRSKADGSVTLIRELAEGVEEAAAAIGHLGEASENIGSIVDVIHGIANQTNLLALNAAIEAARAGEQGRGFAVVADEVRSLAQRTQQSTQEIQSMIINLQAGARQAVEIMGRSRNQAEDSVNAVIETGQALDDIEQAVHVINDMNAQIATAADEQASVGEEMNRNIISIRDLADHTLASTDTLVSACGNLDQLAQRLNQVIGQYQI